MKPTWVIPAILVAGLAGLGAGLGGLAQPASAQDYNENGSGYTDEDRDTGSMDGEGGYDRWSGQYIWDNDRRGDDNGGPRWRDRDDDRRGYGSRQWRRGDDDNTCGPRGRGWSRGENSGRYYGHGYDRDRGYDRDGGNDRDRGYDRREGRGYDSREGNRFNRDDSDRGYRGHGYHHRYHHRQEGRSDGRRDDRSEGRQEQRSEGRQEGRSEGRGGPAQARGMDPASRLDSVKKEIGITAAQEETWTKYAATMKSVADARKTRRESMDRDAILRMSTEDHRKFRDAMIDQRRKEQDSVNSAVDELVKSLDEKQVAIAKEVLPGYTFGPQMRGAGMGMRMGMRCGGGANR